MLAKATQPFRKELTVRQKIDHFGTHISDCSVFKNIDDAQQDFFFFLTGPVTHIQI